MASRRLFLFWLSTFTRQSPQRQTNFQCMWSHPLLFTDTYIVSVLWGHTFHGISIVLLAQSTHAYTTTPLTGVVTFLFVLTITFSLALHWSAELITRTNAWTAIDKTLTLLPLPFVLIREFRAYYFHVCTHNCVHPTHLFHWLHPWESRVAGLSCLMYRGL